MENKSIRLVQEIYFHISFSNKTESPSFITQLLN